jgi:hypothetical protein
MLRSAATPYPERSRRMKQNQLDSSYRTLIVCGSKILRAPLRSYMEL